MNVADIDENGEYICDCDELQRVVDTVINGHPALSFSTCEAPHMFSDRSRSKIDGLQIRPSAEKIRSLSRLAVSKTLKVQAPPTSKYTESTDSSFDSFLSDEYDVAVESRQELLTTNKKEGATVGAGDTIANVSKNYKDSQDDGHRSRKDNENDFNLKNRSPSIASSDSSTSSVAGLVVHNSPYKTGPYNQEIEHRGRSFSSEQMWKMERDNLVLLRRLRACRRGTTMNRGNTIPRKITPSSAINRAARHRQIESENEVLRRRLQNIQLSKSRLTVNNAPRTITRPIRRRDDAKAYDSSRCKIGCCCRSESSVAVGRSEPSKKRT